MEIFVLKYSRVLLLKTNRSINAFSKFWKLYLTQISVKRWAVHSKQF